jgi:hypothetical protein
VFYCFTCQIWQKAVFCVPLSGSVEEKDYLLGTIVDLSTGKTVSGAKIEIPSKNAFTYSDSKDVCNYPVRQFRNDLIKRLIKYDIIYS